MNASGGAFWNEGAQKGKHYAIFAFPRCVVRLEGKFCLPQTHSALLKSCQEICNQFNMSCGVLSWHPVLMWQTRRCAHGPTSLPRGLVVGSAARTLCLRWWVTRATLEPANLGAKKMKQPVKGAKQWNVKWMLMLFKGTLQARVSRIHELRLVHPVHYTNNGWTMCSGDAPAAPIDKSILILMAKMSVVSC